MKKKIVNCCKKVRKVVFSLRKLTKSVDSQAEEGTENHTPSQNNNTKLFELCGLRGKDTCDTTLLENLLQESGPNVQNESGETPLGVALKRLPNDLNYQVFETILRCGGDGMFQFKLNRVLADVLFSFGGRRALYVYLPYHRNVDAVLNRSGESALHILVFRKEIELVKEILNRGANPNVREAEGKTPLHIAVAIGSTNLAEYLLRHGAEVNAQCEEGSTPLHYAFGRMDHGCTSLLLRYRCDVNIKDKKGYTPLFYLMKFPCSDHFVLERILNAGCRVKDAAKEFMPLHILAAESIFSQNAAKYAKLLIKRGINVNERDSQNCTPLHVAARFGSGEFIACLLRYGAQVDVINDDNENPLEIIARRGSTSQIIQMLKCIALKEFTTKQYNIGNIREILDCRIYYREYLEMINELAALAKNKHKVSYLDVYLADRSKLREYAKDEKIVRHVKQLEPHVFPNYGPYIRKRFDAIVSRQEAEAFGIDFLFDTFGGELPLLCARRMVKYFTTQDLWKWRDMVED